MRINYHSSGLPQVRAQDAVTDFVVWTESDTLDARLLACACLVMSASCVAVEQTSAAGVPAHRTSTLQQTGVPAPGAEVLGQASCAFPPTSAAGVPAHRTSTLQQTGVPAPGAEVLGQASCAFPPTSAAGVPAHRTSTLQQTGVPAPGAEVLGQASCAFPPTANEGPAKKPTDAMRNLEKQVLAASGVQRADFCAYVVQFADAGLVRAVTGGNADLDTKVRDWMLASGCVGVWAEQAVP